MKKIIKKQGKTVKAYRLGDNTEVEKNLIGNGKIRKKSDGNYEIFSREAVNGTGEIAKIGDYFKVDSKGHPYPNAKEFFEENHEQLSEDEYIQKPQPMDVWSADMEMCPEIEFLIKNKGLKLSPECPEKYFGAPLWGSYLNAAKDAYLVFYEITRDENGNIADADFNFVARDEYEKLYEEIFG
ncbi:MAG: hypothetical protein ACLRZ9_02745 [Eubacterium sp.]